MKHSIALTFVVTALGAAPVLGAEIRAEKLNRAQLVAATTAKISVKDAIAAAERLSNGGRAVEASYTLQGSPPAATATYDLRAFLNDGVWEGQIAADSGQMIGAGKTIPKAKFDEEDTEEFNLFQRASTTISQAVEVAEQHAQGKAIAVGLEEAGGGVVWNAVVAAGETTRTISVDPLTGRVKADKRSR